jgi:Subtilase family/Secretion system C-terminal sorting domain
MKKTIVSLVLLLATATLFAQNRKGNLRLLPGSNHLLYVAFESSNIPEGYESLVAEYGISAREGFTISPEKFEEMATNAIKNTGSSASVERLQNIYCLSLYNPNNQRLLELAQKLEALKGVAYCTLSPVSPVKPPMDIAPETPLFENEQTYIGPEGVNMAYAWNMGLTGQDINVRDVEYGLNTLHEDLNSVPAFLEPGMVVSPDAGIEYTEHGTAVAGIVLGDKGSYGISGMAYNINEFILYPEWTNTGYDRYDAVWKSINNSSEGDVILFEMQMPGTDTDISYPENYVPAEYDNAIWDLTKAATDAGIIIVSAAGNGSQDLDSPDYTDYLLRGNSGAIVVGAGTPDSFRERLYFSTFGSRVDVQGWGTNVLTSGYGIYYSIDNDFNQGYIMFGGTSSATPIVASCVIVLQSYYHSLTDSYLTPAQMRTLLQETGLQQSGSENIGPLPYMPAAIAAVQNMLGVSDHQKPLFTAWPNPVKDVLTIQPGNITGNAAVEVYTAIGQLVYNTTLSTTTQLNFSTYDAGIYIVKVTNGEKVTTRRIIKN